MKFLAILRPSLQEWTVATALCSGSGPLHSDRIHQLGGVGMWRDRLFTAELRLRRGNPGTLESESIDQQVPHPTGTERRMPAQPDSRLKTHNLDRNSAARESDKNQCRDRTRPSDTLE